MTKTRKYVLTGAALIATSAAGGATALAASGGPADRSHGAVGHGAVSTSMMRSLEPAAMGRMMGQMGVKLDDDQLAAMTRAHDKMVDGMMSGVDTGKGG